MIIKVTNIIRGGEITLPTITYSVKSGVKLHISDEDFYKNDIQIALRKGFIEVVDKQNHKESAFAKNIPIKNLSGRPLAFDNVSLLKDEIKFVSEKEFHSDNLQKALAANRIGLIEEKTNKSSKKQTAKTPVKSVKTKSKIVKEAIKIDAELLEDPDIDFIDKVESEKEHPETRKMRTKIQQELAAESKTKMQAWDPHEQRNLDRQEASDRVAKIVSSKVSNKRSVNDDDVMTGEIDFSKDLVKPTVKKTTLKGKGKPKKAGLKPVGKVRTIDPNAEIDDSLLLQSDEISFVDREQKIERLQKRPDILRARNSRSNSQLPNNGLVE